MLNSARRSLDFAARLVALASEAGVGSAASTWQKSHPRCNQVQHRAGAVSEPAPTASPDDGKALLPGT